VRYGHIVSYVMGTPWAILPEKLAAILDALALQVQGHKLSIEEIAMVVGTVARPSPLPLSQAGRGGSGTAVAVLPLLGTIYQRAGLLTESSGGTSTEAFAKAFRQALADAQVGAIVLDVDSPGGAVNGVDELATEIYRARGTKPIVAVANGTAASAAYWIATAADELIVTPSGEVGSVGVLAVHEDYSKALETEGIRPTLITAGKFKGEASPYQPLTEEARASIQGRVDEYYGMFVRAVARHRGVAADEVRNGFGEGRVVGAKRAVELGMADGVATLDETIERLSRRRRAQGGTRAEADLEMRERRLRLAGH